MKSKHITLTTIIIYIALLKLDSIIPPNEELHLQKNEQQQQQQQLISINAIPRIILVKLVNILRRVSRLAKLPWMILFDKLQWIRDYVEERKDEEGPVKTLIDTFTPTKLESALMAYLPTSNFGKTLQTGTYAVDLFLNSALATFLTTSTSLAYDALESYMDSQRGLKSRMWDGESVKIRVDFLRRGCWCPSVNEHYQALAWLISKKSGGHKDGLFRMAPFESEFGTTNSLSSLGVKSKITELNDEEKSDDGEEEGKKRGKVEQMKKRCGLGDDDDDDDDGSGLVVLAEEDEDIMRDVLDFNIVPANSNSCIIIDHESHQFLVNFDYSVVPDDVQSKDTNAAYTEPSILIQRIGSGPTTIEWMKEWLNRVTLSYIKYQKSNKVRCTSKHLTVHTSFYFNSLPN
jgi:hypothetical protein